MAYRDTRAKVANGSKQQEWLTSWPVATFANSDETKWIKQCFHQVLSGLKSCPWRSLWRGGQICISVSDCSCPKPIPIGVLYLRFGRGLFLYLPFATIPWTIVAKCPQDIHRPSAAEKVMREWDLQIFLLSSPYLMLWFHLRHRSEFALQAWKAILCFGTAT